MKITVKAKIDGGIHLKYGEIIKGKEYEIEEEDFGDQLFERPPGFESPHEKADRERAEAAAAKEIAAAVDNPPQSPLTLRGEVGPASPPLDKGDPGGPKGRGGVTAPASTEEVKSEGGK
jgi:hypothetical protein